MSTNMYFNDKLNNIIDHNNSLVCVGLDPDLSKLPEHIQKLDNPQFEFNKAIIDVTHDLAAVYKPNPAFYEARGERGVRELKMTCDYIHEAYPEVPIIIDAKRGDIGNTNEGYADYVFDYLGGDAITVMPYMGIESLSAFFNREGKGVIVGCHSSNSGAGEFQELIIEDGLALYEVVAEELVKHHGRNPNAMIFMGATYPGQIAKIREITGNMTFLVPGVGAQGGDVQAFLEAGLNAELKGLLINSSRGIIFASNGKDFAERAREEAKKLRDEINLYRVLPGA